MARGDIVLVQLPSSPGNPGHEEIGDRPALVIQDVDKQSPLPTIMIIPFTKVKSAQRFAYTKLVNRSPDNGLDEDSALLIFQLRAIDKSRLKYKIGHLENNILIQVNDDLKRLLGL